MTNRSKATGTRAEVCVVCQKHMPPTAPANAKTCSSTCRVQWRDQDQKRRNAAKRTPRPCQECGQPVAVGRVKYCSEDCLAVATTRRERERQLARHANVCSSCGGPRDRRGRGIKLCAACKEKSVQRAADLQLESSRRYHQRMRADARELRLADDQPPYRDGQKLCKRCHEYLDLDQFPKRATGKGASMCRVCQRAYNQERRLRLTFGLSWDDYELLLACQEYRCAICGGRPRKYVLAVDHDHKTGEIRGLLCSRCNHRLLGAANDDPARLRAAADYLEQFAPREVFGRPRYVPGYGVSS